METKEFVEKCFANFKNIPEEFENKLVEELDKLMEIEKLNYKSRIVEKLLEEKSNMEHDYPKEVRESFKRFIVSFKQINRSFRGLNLLNDKNEIYMYLQTLMMSLMSMYRDLAVLEHDNFVNCLKETRVDLLEKENGKK